MSQATVKATRRELRRAMGTHATTVVDAHEDLLVSRVLPALAAQHERLNKVEFAADAVTLGHGAFRVQTKTLLGRVKWLIRG